MLVCSCSYYNKDENNRIRQEFFEENDTSKINLICWHYDSMGIYPKRTYKIAQEIIEEYDLIGKPLDSIIKYFGNLYNGTIGYDVGSICSENGEIYDGSRSIYILPIENGRLSADDFTIRILQ